MADARSTDTDMETEWEIPDPDPEPEPEQPQSTLESLVRIQAPDLASPWKIFHGDGPNGLLSTDEVDHVIVDVPYSKRVDDGNAADNTRDNPFEFEPMTPSLMERIAQAIGARCRRWTLLMTSDDEVHLWCDALQRAGMNIYRRGHWIRLGGKPQMNGMGPAQGSEEIIIAHSRFGNQRWNGGGKPAIWYANIVRGEERRHPTQKPAQLIKQLIEDFTDPGEIIADPMSGSFSTGITAVSLGRRFLGWDTEVRHVDMARELFKMPLFDSNPLQAGLFAEPKRSTRMANARADLDRDIMRIVSDTPGIKMAEIEVRLGDTDQPELRRALARLSKRSLIRREGRTSDTRYFKVSLREVMERKKEADVPAP